MSLSSERFRWVCAVIRNFSDHAANERTFLSWVRTAIALMAFGFVVERFDIFLRLVPAAARTAHGLRFGPAMGLALMASGLTVLVLASVRFRRMSREIDDDREQDRALMGLDLALAIVVSTVGCALFGYVVLTTR